MSKFKYKIGERVCRRSSNGISIKFGFVFRMYNKGSILYGEDCVLGPYNLENGYEIYQVHWDTVEELGEKLKYYTFQEFFSWGIEKVT